MWNIIKKILIVLEILIILFLVTFFILGKKERIAYMQMSLYGPLSYTNHYVYNFQIEYYDKVFRNSDIYEVYIVKDSIPNYIKEVNMLHDGSRFGRFVSDIEISNTENIKYTLKLKFKIVFYLSLFFILFFVLIFSNKINALFVERNICRIIEIKYLWVTIIFLLSLISPKVVYTVFYKHFDHKNLDNRKFNEYPNIQSNFIDFPKNYEAYFNDYLPFRNELITLKNDIDNMFDSYEIKGTNGVVFNKDFIKFNTGEEYFTLEELNKIKDILILFRDELKKRDIELVLFIAPTKESVYSEFIPTYIRLKDMSAIDKLVSYIKENTDIKVIYPLEELKKYNSLYELYFFSSDVHWNSIGAYIGYLELMKGLNMTNELIPIENVKILKGDGIDKYILTNYTKNNFTMIEGTNEHYTTQYSYSKSDVTNNNNILFIKDSYGYHIFDYIASSFNTTIFIHRDSFNIDYIRERDINLVILEYAGFRIKDLLEMTNWRIDEINKD